MRPVQYRREPEPLKLYLKRLYQGTAGLIGLLVMYEKQVTRDRFRELSPLSRRMDQYPSRELARQFTDFIQQLYGQLRNYKIQYPEVARRREIRQRRNYLERKYRLGPYSPALESLSLTLRRQGNETAEEYQKRLDLGCAGMIGLLEQYEKRARLERSQQLFPYSRRVDGKASEEVARGLTSLIKDFYTQLCLYEAQFPALSRKREIRQRKRQLEKILSS